MKRDKDKREVGRRDVLRLAGLGGVAGAAAVAGSVSKTEAAEESTRTGSSYRETEHVLKYYELAKF